MILIFSHPSTKSTVGVQGQRFSAEQLFKIGKLNLAYSKFKEYSLYFYFSPIKKILKFLNFFYRIIFLLTLPLGLRYSIKIFS
jgi:hypothetical protein